ncbi:crosslink repair DNA glycosylase YcaQ family protein [Sulfitobacter sp. LCG007]
MSLLKLGNSQARRLFLDRHALAEVPQGPSKGADLLALIERLGFVQIDSINTVARAHDLILFSRRPSYRPRSLQRLHERDRALFEHWTHDASVIPLSYYPWWHLRRCRDAAALRQRYRDWQQHDFEHRFDHVLEHIRVNGPVSSSDFGEGEERSNGGGWWEWHPSKTALEYLWRSGALCVVGRDNFRKRYDLTERVLEEALCDPARMPDEAETIDWCCSGALDRLGFASHGEIAAFWGHVSVEEAKDWCAVELAAGRLETVGIEGADGVVRAAYARPGLADDPAICGPVTPRLRVLSPFDPALRDRRRALRLFGFDYRIEIFVPEAKRRYGYYVFPILEGDSIVGRVDMKAFRDRDTLVVRALWPEPRVRWGKGRQQAFEAELHRLIRLAGVSRVAFQDGWLRDCLAAV